MLVVAIVLCSALAGKACAVSLSNASLLSIPNPLILVVKDSTGPPVDDRVRQSIWQNGENTYNITVDGCIIVDTVVGIYQFANGTSKNDTTIEEISQDLLASEGPNSALLREKRFATQLLANVRLAKKEIDAYVYDQLHCGDITVSSIDRTELRRLLAIPDGHWAAVLVKGTVAVGVGGLGIAVYYATDSWAIRAGTFLPIVYFGAIITGAIDRAQKNGRMNYLDSLSAIMVSGLLR